MLNTSSKLFLVIGSCIVTALTFADFNIVAVSINAITKGLHMSPMQFQWAINIYLLMLASLVIPVGALADKYPNKIIILFGIAMFLFASVCCAFANNAVSLIAGRLFQGLGAVCISTPVFNLIVSVFPDNARNRMIGIVMAVGSFFIVLSPLLGGLITEFLSWHWIFLVNIPFSIAAFWFFMNVIEPPKMNNLSIDYTGALLLISIIIIFTVALMNCNQWKWYYSISSGIIILLLAVLLYNSQKKSKYPLINLQLFANKKFMTASIITFLIQMLLIASVYWMVFMQKGLHYSPFVTGLLMLPNSIMLIACSYLSGKCIDRLGPTKPLIYGSFIIFFAYVAMCLVFSITPNYYSILFGLLGLGVGAFFITNSTRELIIQQVDVAHTGKALGMFSAIRQVGGCAGLALLAAVYTDTYSRQIVLGHAVSIAVISAVKVIFYVLAATGTLIFLFAYNFIRRSNQ